MDPHGTTGDFRRWVENEYGRSLPQAQRYMRVARNKHTILGESRGIHLSLNEALRQLAAPKDDEPEEAPPVLLRPSWGILVLAGEELVGEAEVLLLLRPLLPRPHAEAHREEEVVVLARTQGLEGRVPRVDVLLEAVVREFVLERGAVAEISHAQAAVLVGDEAGAY